MKPYYQDEKVTIYHGDCLDILPKLKDIDLVLTDPPYGINFVFTKKRKRKSGLNWKNNMLYVDPDWKNIKGDDRPFDPSHLLHYDNVVIWGANNFSHLLPQSRGWLIWDKLGDKGISNYGDCEVAWTNKDMVIRIHRQVWRGCVREGENNVSNGPKVHPCQKPIELMRWCLTFFPESKIILDPYMGSGTTLRAAKDFNKYSIGIDIEEKYCEIAAERMTQEVLNI